MARSAAGSGRRSVASTPTGPVSRRAAKRTVSPRTRRATAGRRWPPPPARPGPDDRAATRGRSRRPSGRAGSHPLGARVGARRSAHLAAAPAAAPALPRRRRPAAPTGPRSSCEPRPQPRDRPAPAGRVRAPPRMPCPERGLADPRLTLEHQTGWAQRHRVDELVDRGQFSSTTQHRHAHFAHSIASSSRCRETPDASLEAGPYRGTRDVGATRVETWTIDSGVDVRRGVSPERARGAGRGEVRHAHSPCGSAPIWSERPRRGDQRARHLASCSYEHAAPFPGQLPHPRRPRAGARGVRYFPASLRNEFWSVRRTDRGCGRLRHDRAAVHPHAAHVGDHGDLREGWCDSDDCLQARRRGGLPRG